MDPKPEWHCRIGRVTRKGGATVRVVQFPRSAPNADATEMVQGLLERLRAGRSVAAAIVEVKPDGFVATGWRAGPHYHSIQSGVATLASRLGRVGE